MFLRHGSLERPLLLVAPISAMVQAASFVLAAVAGPHHEDSHLTLERIVDPDGVLFTFQIVIEPGESPAERIGNGGVLAESYLSMGVAPLRAVNPGAHDQIDVALQASAEGHVVGRRVAGP